MLNRERISFEMFIKRIDELSPKKKFIIFTSEHEVEVGISSLGIYYVNDANFDHVQHFADIEKFINCIKKSLNITSKDENTTDLDELSDKLKHALSNVIMPFLNDIAKLEPVAAIQALQVILIPELDRDELDETNKELFEMQGVLHAIKFIRRMLKTVTLSQAKLFIHSLVDKTIQQQKMKIPSNSTMNGGHKYTIEIVLQDTFEDIALLEPQAAITALKAITSDRFYLDKELFRAQNILGGIKEVRKILNHPCPQNKVQNYKYFGKPSNPEIIVYKYRYKDEYGVAHEKPAFERKGMLNLSSRLNEATYVTKEEVVNYIHVLINKAMRQQQDKLNKLLPINHSQRNIIEEVLQNALKNILKLNTQDVIRALESIHAGRTLFALNLRFFRQLGVGEDLRFIREILAHPCPQNRKDNDPNFDAPTTPEIVVYKSTQGKPAFEHRGLLNLTVYDDELTTSVTKEAVVKYINMRINTAIFQQKNLLAQQTSMQIDNGSEKISDVLTSRPNAEDFTNFPSLPVVQHARYFKSSSQNTQIEDTHSDDISGTTMDSGGLGSSFSADRAPTCNSFFQASRRVRQRLAENVERSLTNPGRNERYRSPEAYLSGSSLFAVFAPNLAMITALNRLGGTLTLDHLKRWTELYHKPITSFTEIHAEALIHLVRDELFSPINAIDMITQLNQDQLRVVGQVFPNIN